MNEELKDKLNALCEEMSEHVKYLRDETYHPYDKEEANEIQKFKEEHKCETLIEAVIACIADAVSIGSMNFSKLED